jgi:hypothetical protein
MQVIIRIQLVWPENDSIFIGPSTKMEAVRWLRKNKFKKCWTKKNQHSHDVWQKRDSQFVICKGEKGEYATHRAEVQKIRPLENCSIIH